MLQDDGRSGSKTSWLPVIPLTGTYGSARGFNPLGATAAGSGVAAASPTCACSTGRQVEGTRTELLIPIGIPRDAMASMTP